MRRKKEGTTKKASGNCPKTDRSLKKKHTRRKENGCQESKRKLYKPIQTAKYLIRFRKRDDMS